MTIELSEYVIDAIADAVVKKMQEPKTGHWKTFKHEGEDFYECSCCGETEILMTPFCPLCGSRMVEPQKSEDAE